MRWAKINFSHEIFKKEDARLKLLTIIILSFTVWFIGTSVLYYTWDAIIQDSEKWWGDAVTGLRAMYITHSAVYPLIVPLVWMKRTRQMARGGLSLLSIATLIGTPLIFSRRALWGVEALLVMMLDFVVTFMIPLN
jgi:hypothetical protein